MYKVRRFAPVCASLSPSRSGSAGPLGPSVSLFSRQNADPASSSILSASPLRVCTPKPRSRTFTEVLEGLDTKGNQGAGHRSDFILSFGSGVADLRPSRDTEAIKGRTAVARHFSPTQLFGICVGATRVELCTEISLRPTDLSLQVRHLFAFPGI